MVATGFGLTMPPQRVAKEFHDALAQLFCQHQVLGSCEGCYTTVTPLVKPLARALTTAGVFERANKFDGFVAISKAIDVIKWHARGNPDAEVPYDYDASLTHD